MKSRSLMVFVSFVFMLAAVAALLTIIIIDKEADEGERVSEEEIVSRVLTEIDKAQTGQSAVYGDISFKDVRAMMRPVEISVFLRFTQEQMQELIIAGAPVENINPAPDADGLFELHVGLTSAEGVLVDDFVIVYSPLFAEMFSQMRLGILRDNDAFRTLIANARVLATLKADPSFGDLGDEELADVSIAEFIDSGMRFENNIGIFKRSGARFIAGPPQTSPVAIDVGELRTLDTIVTLKQVVYVGLPWRLAPSAVARLFPEGEMPEIVERTPATREFFENKFLISGAFTESDVGVPVFVIRDGALRWAGVITQTWNDAALVASTSRIFSVFPQLYRAEQGME